MENKLGPEAIKVIKRVYNALLLAHERLADVVYASEDNYGEDKLERTRETSRNYATIICGFGN